MINRVIRLIAFMKGDETADPNGEMIGDIIEFDAGDKARYKMYLRMLRSSIRAEERTRLEIYDPSKPWVRPTDRQNRIEDAKTCLEQIRVARARLRAALSGNYEGCP